MNVEHRLISKIIRTGKFQTAQKLRVTRHLANVFRSELEHPGSMSGRRGITQLVAGLETGKPI